MQRFSLKIEKNFAQSLKLIYRTNQQIIEEKDKFEFKTEIKLSLENDWVQLAKLICSKGLKSIGVKVQNIESH